MKCAALDKNRLSEVLYLVAVTVGDLCSQLNIKKSRSQSPVFDSYLELIPVSLGRGYSEIVA